MQAEFPLVSCLCLTYARPKLLREAIWCFLQQDWPNKEMIIVNDHPEPLQLDRPYPGVQIHNVPERYSCLGAKRNASAGLAEGDYLFVWDDDDLHLPWRISLSMQHLLANPEKWAFKPISGLTSTHNENYAIVQNQFHSQLAIRRAAFDHVGGYGDINSGEDIHFEGRIPANRWIHYPVRPHELIYVYRWGNNITHISGLGTDRPGEPTAWEKVAEYNADRPGGGVVTPGFYRDYWRDIATWAAAAPGVSPEEARLLEERLKPHYGCD